MSFDVPAEVHKGFKAYCNRLGIKNKRYVPMTMVMNQFMYETVKDNRMWSAKLLKRGKA